MIYSERHDCRGVRWDGRGKHMSKIKIRTG